MYEKCRRGELLGSAKPRYYCLGQYLHYAVLRQKVIILKRYIIQKIMKTHIWVDNIAALNILSIL